MAFDRKWYSHQFRGPELRFEVSVYIRSRKIVWANGPFQSRRFADLTVFNRNLVKHLLPGEMVGANSGYKHPPCLHPTGLHENQNVCHARVRARHENVNGRLKHFNAITRTFRHDKNLHGLVFHAIVQLTYLMLSTSEPLYDLFIYNMSSHVAWHSEWTSSSSERLCTYSS